MNFRDVYEEVIRAYYLGSNGRKPERPTITVHPQYLRHIATLPEYYVQFNSDNTITYRYKESYIKEDPDFSREGFSFHPNPNLIDSDA